MSRQKTTAPPKAPTPRLPDLAEQVKAEADARANACIEAVNAALEAHRCRMRVRFAIDGDATDGPHVLIEALPLA